MWPFKRKPILAGVRGMNVRAVLRVVWLLALTSSGNAAEIVAAPLNSPDEALIAIDGEFLLSDVEKFRKVISQYSKGVVLFHSNGGNAVAGIRIGELIRLKGYSTIVPEDTQCASACAIAWLGGTRRLMGANAQIGFHAAYVVRSGQATEWGAANALVGAYLNKIGLPDRAIVYITQAPPGGMTWLSLTEAQEKGIGVVPYELSKEKGQTKLVTPVKPPAPKPAQKTATIPTARITAGQIVGRWGLAAYHSEDKKPLAIDAARAGCSRQTYTIAPGPSGGIMMHLADERAPRELSIKSGVGQKIFIGPAGAAGGEFDREVVAFDSYLMILRFVDPEVSNRYGIMVFARCAS